MSARDNLPSRLGKAEPIPLIGIAPNRSFEIAGVDRRGRHHARFEIFTSPPGRWRRTDNSNESSPLAGREHRQVTPPVRRASVAGPRGAGICMPKKSTITSPDLNSSAITSTMRFSRSALSNAAHRLAPGFCRNRVNADLRPIIVGQPGKPLMARMFHHHAKRIAAPPPDARRSA